MSLSAPILETSFARTPRLVLSTFDSLVFSGVWAASVAAILVCAASLALGVSPRWDVVTLAFAGTLVVYPLDRLRDLERDRGRAPLRSAFVERYRRSLRGLVLLSGVASLVLAWRFSTAIWLLCGTVLVAGMLHRRLKRIGRGKTVYVSLAWTIVVVGLPALAQRQLPPTRVIWVAVVIFAAVFSNLVTSNLAVKGGASPSSGEWRYARGRRLALTSAAFGTTLALFGPTPALSAVPCAQALALLCRRDGERYGQGVIDGALLVGGLVTCGLSRIGG